MSFFAGYSDPLLVAIRRVESNSKNSPSEMYEVLPAVENTAVVLPRQFLQAGSDVVERGACHDTSKPFVVALVMFKRAQLIRPTSTSWWQS
jgi:hypothetical protein